jgi:hypothetical protein
MASLLATSASHAARCVACHGVRSHPVPVTLGRRVLHPGGVDGRAPAALVVAGELKIVALVRHEDSHTAGASPSRGQYVL